MVEISCDVERGGWRHGQGAHQPAEAGGRCRRCQIMSRDQRRETGELSICCCLLLPTGKPLQDTIRYWRQEMRWFASWVVHGIGAFIMRSANLQRNLRLLLTTDDMDDDGSHHTGHNNVTLHMTDNHNEKDWLDCTWTGCCCQTC